MNRKGFTLIELLGVIAIIGILSVVVISAVAKYIGSSKSKSFVLMNQGAYQAAENCILHDKVPECKKGQTISIKDVLYNNGYIHSLKNPDGSSSECNGTVEIVDSGTNGGTDALTSYKYIVYLACPGYRETTIEWPNKKSMNELMGM